MRNSPPKFNSEAEERAYWAKHDSAGRVDWTKAKRTGFPALRATTRPSSARRKNRTGS